jgi:hypothetical protein
MDDGRRGVQAPQQVGGFGDSALGVAVAQL